VLLGVLEAARQGRIHEPARLDRFVLGTCRNTVLRLRQQAQRTPLADAGATAALSVLRPDRVELLALFGCMRELEGRALQVIQQSFLEERSAEEIAAALALSEGNVRVIRHRALAALRRCLDAGELQP
jgi:RNA polymerase sigma-70 factor (ECF subfamily)